MLTSPLGCKKAILDCALVPEEFISDNTSARDPLLGTLRPFASCAVDVEVWPLDGAALDRTKSAQDLGGAGAETFFAVASVEEDGCSSVAEVDVVEPLLGDSWAF